MSAPITLCTFGIEIEKIASILVRVNVVLQKLTENILLVQHGKALPDRRRVAYARNDLAKINNRAKKSNGTLCRYVFNFDPSHSNWYFCNRSK
ncbi:MAG: hypothetical protein KME46_21220 [Brasilonema angustatum HA4187-MV1]|nr:hypothetical protein [Brasilonema angustatum HA4187-MV1]